MVAVLTHRKNLWAVPFLIFTAGCSGSKIGDVTGKVTYQGKPLVAGSVVFIVPDRPPVVARIEADGTYTAKSVAVGEISVTVHSPDPAAQAKKMGKGAGDLAKGDEPPPTPANGPEAVKGWFPIPETYGDARSSGLTYTIKPGENAIHIELK